MGQEWAILDLDSRAFIGGDGKLGEWFWRGDPGIMETLRVPQTDLKIDAMLRGVVADQRASPLLRLPADLFDPVLKELVGVDDEGIYSALSLAVTCKAILSLSRKLIISRQRKYLHFGAGHRIICVGEYAQHPSQLPPGMLTAEEEQELLSFESHDLERPPALLEYAAECFSSFDILSRSRYPLYGAFIGSRPRTPSHWFPGDWALIWDVGSGYYPKDRPWVLCNRTKHEYVREQAATQMCESLLEHRRRDWDRLEFWHFLLASICWSPDDSISMPYNDDPENTYDDHEDGDHDTQANDADGRKRNRPLTRGRWAGDRFAITLLEGLAAQGKGSWKDITDEVGELVTRVWKAEYDK